MKKVFVSLAVIAAVTAAAPAAAKPGQGHGAHKAEKHRGQKGGADRLGRLGGDGYYAERGWRDGARNCPPGLAKKNNGCLPPGQAKKLGIGDRLPAYLSGYNVPARFQDRYRDNGAYSYRYEDQNIYRVDRRSGVIDEIISVLGL